MKKPLLFPFLLLLQLSLPIKNYGTPINSNNNYLTAQEQYTKASFADIGKRSNATTMQEATNLFLLKNNRSTIFRLFSTLPAPDDSARISPNFFQDLEIFCGQNGESNSLLGNIVNQSENTTIAGEAMLVHLLSNPTCEVKALRRRQALFQSLQNNPELLELLTDKLKKIKAIEPDLLGALADNKTDGYLHEQYIFPHLPSSITKNRYVLELLQRPELSVIASLTGLTAFCLVTGATPTDPKTGPKSISMSLLQAPSLQAFSIPSTRSSMQKLQKGLILARNFMDKVEELEQCAKQEKTFEVLLEKKEVDPELKKLLTELSSGTFKSSPSYFSSFGNITLTHQLMKENNDQFLSYVMQKVGKIDAFVTIANLIARTEKETSLHYSFPTYLEGNKPQLAMNDLWHPALASKNPVPNSIKLGGDEEKKDGVFTGANSSGKSTFLKILGTSSLLGQTFGVVPGSSATMTPFKVIFTSMRIRDCLGEKSLFQSEAAQIKKLVDSVDQTDKPCLVVLDEAFSTTSSDESIEASKSLLGRLGKSKHAITCMATHHRELTNLGLQKNSTITNYKVPMNKKEDGSLKRPYKLEKGISQDNFAKEVIEESGLQFLYAESEKTQHNYSKTL